MIGLLTFAVAFAAEPDWRSAYELSRFPRSEVCREQARLAWDDSVRASQVAGLNADVPEFGWTRVAKASDWRYQCWQELRSARQGIRLGGYSTTPRDHLDSLRVLLGDEAYEAGVMPWVK